MDESADGRGSAPATHARCAGLDRRPTRSPRTPTDDECDGPWSYQLLDPDEQRAFRRFGALPGLFPIDAAAAVLAGRKGAHASTDALAAAGSLIDKSLLLRAKASAVATCPLYYMLESVGAYAALELIAAGERDDALEGLVRYCVGEASLAAEGLLGPEQAEWLDRVRDINTVL